MNGIRNEDELPVDITDQQYDEWFKLSFVWQGVRMGPWPMPELKGCPFCGRQPSLSCRGATESERSEIGEIFFICGIAGAGCVAGASERSEIGEIFFITCHCGGNNSKAWQYGYTIQEAQAAWNERK